MPRPIVYDLTHLQHRLAYDAPSGIDRVDLLFAHHFSHGAGSLAAAGHYGRTHLKLSPASHLADLVSAVEARWHEDTGLAEDPTYTRTAAWLRGDVPPEPAPQPPKGLHWQAATKLLPFVRHVHRTKPDRAIVPDGTIYLNVAQHSTEHARFFTWLKRRPDVQAVFFLHDLLPLDYPEFWWDGHEALFGRRIDVILDHATALITSSASVRDRIALEYRRRGRVSVPILASALPSALEITAAGPVETGSPWGDAPYFVVLGTVEPRKNHLLLLNVWRRLAEAGAPPAKLVLIGQRGWENQQTVALLERCPGLKDHVWEISGCSSATVRALLTHARGLLMPSFAEGYGLPLVESLGLGTPVVASDIPVFREVTQGKALFLDPTDGLGWSAAITALSDSRSESAIAAKRLAAGFKPRTVSDYFATIDAFLESL